MYRLLLPPVCALMLSCASAPSSAAPDVSQAGGPPIVALYDGLNGFTLCRDGEAESWFHEDYRDNPRTVAHEKMHRDQLNNDPRGCLGRLTDQQRRYKDELDAFCAGIRAAVEEDMWSYKDGVRWSYRALATYGFHKTTWTIRKDLINRCPK